MNTQEMIVQLGAWGVSPKQIAQEIGVTTRSIEFLRNGTRKGGVVTTYEGVRRIHERHKRRIARESKYRGSEV